MEMEHESSSASVLMCSLFCCCQNKGPNLHIAYCKIFQLTTNMECIKDKFYGTFWTFISLFPYYAEILHLCLTKERKKIIQVWNDMGSKL